MKKYSLLKVKQEFCSTVLAADFDAFCHWNIFLGICKNVHIFKIHYDIIHEEKLSLWLKIKQTHF